MSGDSVYWPVAWDLLIKFCLLQGRRSGESFGADGFVGQRRGTRFVYIGGTRGQLLNYRWRNCFVVEGREREKGY